MIDLELYRIFYEVAKAGNITLAANNLNISQPAVTKHIKNLEYQLNCSLFVRNHKGVILTEGGKRLYLNIKQALQLIENGENEIKKLTELKQGTLKIGISTTLTKKYLMNYIRTYHNLYPNIIIEISTDPTSQLKDQLREGKIDFILAKIPEEEENDLEYVDLGELEDIFIANNNYSELKNKIINVNELVKYPILLQKEPSSSRELMEEYFKRNQVKVQSIMNIASSNLLIDFVKIGYGIGVVTKQYVKEELEAKELFEVKVNPPFKKRHFGIIKLKNTIISSSAKAMINLITE